VLVTGSNRGLGLEFVKQYAGKGWTVIATVRDPSTAPELAALAAQHRNITVEKLDVGNRAEIIALAARYQGKPIDVLLNNAGLLGDREKQGFKQLDYATFEEVLRVNTYAPLAMAQAFMPNVVASEQKKIVTLTSGLSSIANTRRSADLYFYRVSKAGVNMAMHALQSDVRDQGVKVGILAPGMVETRLLRQSGYAGAAGVLSTEQSVAAVIRNIENLNQDAEIVLYTGEKVPW
jgi:NAD(P)-dependent dehydrogenase (short-subunit alcohol dehydrogenase family)